MTDRTNIAIANTWEVKCDFTWHKYIWPWPILKVKVKVMHILTVNILQTMKHEQTLQLPTRRKLRVAIQLAYWYLTVAHSKGQGQVQAYFDCEYLANDDS